ncbi:MazG family protein [Gordonia soli]|uniref:Putative hydrolase n=1 Tax=Gordonia soli NBRC 108243 TaxID=1223545 RepID=M0QJV2_9ACTN|nr:MazG family protein [Gordonia soli]GAC68566.1 putative hydrolase [Gordonia soli NBRC 108243]
MTVILLDPLRPDTIPIPAVRHVAGPVVVTEDVNPFLLWELGEVSAATDEHIAQRDVTVVSTDRTHPVVRARIDLGDNVIEAKRAGGEALLDAVALMDTLRRNGPWESQQTHWSLRRYLLEEVYETLDAIATGDPDHLREELGDLLLQILFHSRIAADDPERPFDIDDVARAFTEKVSRRTPGILSGAHSDLETQIREWEERKAAEKQRGSVLDGIADSQPALALAQKVLERLSAAGYPVDSIDPDILTVTVRLGDDSVEDQTRRRILAVMEGVRDLESQAASEGIVLDSRDGWLQVMGVVEVSAGAPVGGPDSASTPDPIIDDGDADDIVVTAEPRRRATDPDAAPGDPAPTGG